ncbi:flavin reductase (DIM6/NTAB) family NADH-FMN oxidoreductase RutF [Cytobacillus firmus]|uniref:Flavin reductase (DIM6/NTAB) family NADH-FMN oxidoreductase RutF n=2 Tax=Cytobacillus TaxID=2675230 RepID=A0A366K5G7_CYTFI|nr:MULTISPECIES: flavin reductase family protein [Cytobacillus]RBP96517.1 flavin reductase (DIM6/NTAB) family NADH-FMN oxidoreductase RutF [Cytobacillus firmus]TDX45756.1 flavin reductase (DIM6/NTAB) family NADH-FMN oxidoreductase RutF [Cytobacillus oceanisediminis]
MEFNPSELGEKEVYKLLTGSVVPRPIAWVSTVSEEGGQNLAPFSFFTVASRNPPMLCISIGPGVGDREGTEKDTLVNIRETKEFVINVVPAPLGNQMQKSAENLPSEADEFKAAGLSAAESRMVAPKRVKEAPIHMECKLEQIINLGSDHLIIGRMVHYHIDDDYYLGNYKVNLEKLQPLGRLAGNYSESSEFFKLPR